ncbi:MAG TPA: FAD binding domain-containing protein, partial [Dehalococcoidia bacterium]|nr:FAD binding domain-containing protein [Dehalococcoidia bacterium]
WLRIGALASVATVAGSPLIVERYPALAQAARSVGVPPLRHVATVGGNLSLDTRCIYYNQSELWRQARPPCLKLGGDVCHVVEKGRRCLAVHQGDLAPALMALGAAVVIMRAAGERVLPLGDFFTGDGKSPNTLGTGELLAEVRIPPAGPASGSAYEKLRVREAMDFPLASAAVSLRMDGRGSIGEARVVLGAMAAGPLDITSAGAVLAGQKIGDGLNLVFDQVAQQAYERAHPADNLAMDAGYRGKMTRVLVRRALARALASAQGAS